VEISNGTIWVDGGGLGRKLPTSAKTNTSPDAKAKTNNGPTLVGGAVRKLPPRIDISQEARAKPKSFPLTGENVARKSPTKTVVSSDAKTTKSDTLVGVGRKLNAKPNISPDPKAKNNNAPSNSVTTSSGSSLKRSRSTVPVVTVNDDGFLTTEHGDVDLR